MRGVLVICARLHAALSDDRWGLLLQDSRFSNDSSSLPDRSALHRLDPGHLSKSTTPEPTISRNRPSPGSVDGPATGQPLHLGNLAHQAPGRRELLRVGCLVPVPTRGMELGEGPRRLRPGRLAVEAYGGNQRKPGALGGTGIHGVHREPEPLHPQGQDGLPGGQARPDRPEGRLRHDNRREDRKAEPFPQRPGHALHVRRVPRPWANTTVSSSMARSPTRTTWWTSPPRRSTSSSSGTCRG